MNRVVSFTATSGQLKARTDLRFKGLLDRRVQLRRHINSSRDSGTDGIAKEGHSWIDVVSVSQCRNFDLMWFSRLSFHRVSAQRKRRNVRSIFQGKLLILACAETRREWVTCMLLSVLKLSAVA